MTKNNCCVNRRDNSGRKSGLVICIVAVVFIFIGLALMKSGNSKSEGLVSGQTSLNDLIGKSMPDISLFDKDGREYSLGNLKGKNVVLFFNEGIMCYPACWNQVAAFGTDQKFNNLDTVAISIVVDRPQDWEKAMSKMPDLAKATILFDQNATVSRQLGLLTLPSSMHKGSIPGHTYIVLDKQGVVRYVNDDPTMAINNDMLYNKITEFKE